MFETFSPNGGTLIMSTLTPSLATFTSMGLQSGTKKKNLKRILKNYTFVLFNSKKCGILIEFYKSEIIYRHHV